MTTNSRQEDVDLVLDALADRQRRRILAYLEEHGTATRRELADVLTGWLASDRDGTASAGDRERIRIELRHVHLPRLETSGLVDRVDATDTVTLAETEPWVDRVLELALTAEFSAGEPTSDRHGTDGEVPDEQPDGGGARR